MPEVAIIGAYAGFRASLIRLHGLRHAGRWHRKVNGLKMELGHQAA